MSQRILIAGGTGRLGQPLASALRANGVEVHTVARSASASPHHHVADLAQAEEVHLLVADLAPAVIVNVTGGPRPDPVELARANVVVTTRLCDAAVANGVEHVITVGSAAEYGASAPGPERLPRPVNDYGRAKLAASHVAAAILQDSPTSLMVARPFNIISPGMPRSSPLGNIVAQLSTGDPEPTVICGRLDVVRDFVPIGFVIEALVHLVGTRAPGSIDICSGVGTELGEIVAAIVTELGVRPQIVPDPELLALPAGDVVLGDPAPLAELGLGVVADPRSLALIALDSHLNALEGS